MCNSMLKVKKGNWWGVGVGGIDQKVLFVTPTPFYCHGGIGAKKRQFY